MSTVTNPNSVSGPNKPTNETPKDHQLRKDRITFGIVLALVALLIGLMVWLASISPGVESSDYQYWMY